MDDRLADVVEVRTFVATVTNMLDTLADPDDLPLPGRIAVWAELDDLARTLSVHVRGYSVACATAMTDDELLVPDLGLVHREQRSTDSWDGRGILNALQDPLVSPGSGEWVDAVPVSVLADVLPAVDGKSSRWRVTGLKRHGVDPDQYRTREWQMPTIRRGPKR